MQCRVRCVGKISSGIAEGFSEMGQEKGRGEGSIHVFENRK